MLHDTCVKTHPVGFSSPANPSLHVLPPESKTTTFRVDDSMCFTINNVPSQNADLGFKFFDYVHLIDVSQSKVACAKPGFNANYKS